ncbi:hypothetical protein AB1Y20_021868 [Prymnesium parvum]|uniref:Origin recognition complex subunit 2 n=1 Tax=Prymnesium parvum TaxID=97485 RepID=A0AB34JNF2_PRYPA
MTPAAASMPSVGGEGELDDFEVELEGEEAAAAAEELDTEEDEVAAAAEFFRSQRATRRRPKRSLASLPGGEADELTRCVHSILHASLEADAPPAAHAPAWLSSLACGCSLLFHGFGSKRLELERLGAALAHTAPVLTLHGACAGARVSDLLVLLLQQVLRVRDLPARSNAQLLRRTRAAFAAHAAAKPPARAAGYVTSHVQRLLPTPPTVRKRAVEEPVDEEWDEAEAWGDEGERASAGEEEGEEEAEEAGDEAGEEGEAAVYARKAKENARRAAELERQAERLEQLEQLQRAQPAGAAAQKVCPEAARPAASTPPAPAASWAPSEAREQPRKRPRWLTELRESNITLPFHLHQHLVHFPFHAKTTTASQPKAAVDLVYIIVHDIDAPPLRAEASQATLAALAAMPQVRLIASCSHRNAALLWDAQKARLFAWRWVELSTSRAYAHETRPVIHSFLAGLHDAAHGTHTSSAFTVLSQLTERARRAFRALCAFQLANPARAGLSLPEWCALGRGAWFATQESALRTHIAEYETHHLVRMRPAEDGQQCYYCVLPTSAMQQIVAKLPE